MGNSYKKLQEKNNQLDAEIKKLRNQLATVILKPDSIEAAEIKFTVKLWSDLETQIWAGDPSETVIKFNGFFQPIIHREQEIRLVNEY